MVIDQFNHKIKIYLFISIIFFMQIEISLIITDITFSEKYFNTNIFRNSFVLFYKFILFL